MSFYLAYHRSLLSPFYDNLSGLGEAPYLHPYFNFHGPTSSTTNNTWKITQPPTRFFLKHCTLNRDKWYWYSYLINRGNPPQFPEGTTCLFSLSKNVVLKEVYIETKVTTPTAVVCWQVEVFSFLTELWNSFKCSDYLATAIPPSPPTTMPVPHSAPWSGTYVVPASAYEDCHWLCEISGPAPYKSALYSKSFMPGINFEISIPERLNIIHPEIS